MPVLDAEQLADRFRKTDPRDVRDDCPAATQLWAAVTGGLAAEEVRRVVDHTARCIDCSIAWRVALDVNRETPDAPGAALLPLHRRRARSLLLPGGLTLLAAGLAAALFFQGPWAHPYRSGALELERGIKRPLDSLTAPGPQPKDAVVLRWTPYPGAERYSVTVMSSSLEVLYRKFGVTTSELRIPPEALSTQPSGGRALWSVQAILPGGRTVDSEVFTVDFR